MKYKVIGLSGKAGSGKDYLTNKYFVPLGYKQFSLAWHFKISLCGRGTFTYDDVFYHKPPIVRRELQLEGTERGRNVYGEDVWCKTMFGWFELLSETWGINQFIVADIRFPNEVKFVQQMGGKVFRIDADDRVEDNKLTLEARQHISETALDEYDGFDDFIINTRRFENEMDRHMAKLIDRHNLNTK
jgi:hypothetical protein